MIECFDRPKTKREAISTPSGWSKERKRLGSKGDVPIYNGDLYDEGSKSSQLSVVFSDLGDVSVFSELVDLQNMVGKRVSQPYPVYGSDVMPRYDRHVFEEKEPPVRFLIFDDGSISVPLVKGEVFISPFDQDQMPIMDFLITIGAVTPEKARSQTEWYKKRDQLAVERRELSKKRNTLQNSLVKDSQPSVYSEIEEIEATITGINQKLKAGSEDGFKPFWLDRLPSLAPNLVPILGPRSLSYHPKIVRIVRALKESEDYKYFTEVYSFEFEDGTFSELFAACNGHWTMIPVDRLWKLGILSRHEAKMAGKKIVQAIKRSIESSDNRARLREIKDELEQFGLGERKTRRLIEEKQEIEQLLEV